MINLAEPVIVYRRGYRYQLEEPYLHQTRIAEEVNAQPYLSINSTGVLLIGRGYAWDGPSGPAFDTRNFMRGSLVHDAIYQLIRLGWIGRDWRLYADQLLREICREDGMSAIRAWWVYRSLRIFGDSAAMPSAERPIERAP